MDAFHYEHVVGQQFQPASALLAASRLEVIARQLNLLARKERVELLVEQRDVERVEALVVVVALVVLRRKLTVDEIIVQRNLHRLDAAREQLYGQTLAERCLAARRRPDISTTLTPLRAAIMSAICDIFFS